MLQQEQPAPAPVSRLVAYTLIVFPFIFLFPLGPLGLNLFGRVSRSYVPAAQTVLIVYYLFCIALLCYSTWSYFRKTSGTRLRYIFPVFVRVRVPPEPGPAVQQTGMGAATSRSVSASHVDPGVATDSVLALAAQLQNDTAALRQSYECHVRDATSRLSDMEQRLGQLEGQFASLENVPSRIVTADVSTATPALTTLLEKFQAEQWPDPCGTDNAGLDLGGLFHTLKHFKDVAAHIAEAVPAKPDGPQSNLTSSRRASADSPSDPPTGVTPPSLDAKAPLPLQKTVRAGVQCIARIRPPLTLGDDSEVGLDFRDFFSDGPGLYESSLASLEQSASPYLRAAVGAAWNVIFATDGWSGSGKSYTLYGHPSGSLVDLVDGFIGSDDFEMYMLEFRVGGLPHDLLAGPKGSQLKGSPVFSQPPAKQRFAEYFRTRIVHRDVRPTTNNDSSSRGHMLCRVNWGTSVDGNPCSVTMLDVAGGERIGDVDGDITRFITTSRSSLRTFWEAMPKGRPRCSSQLEKCLRDIIWPNGGPQRPLSMQWFCHFRPLRNDYDHNVGTKAYAVAILKTFEKLPKLYRTMEEYTYTAVDGADTSVGALGTSVSGSTRRTTVTEDM